MSVHATKIIHPAQKMNSFSERDNTDSCRVGEDRNSEGSPLRGGIIAITRGASAEIFENNVHHVILLLPSRREINEGQLTFLSTDFPSRFLRSLPVLLGQSRHRSS